MPADKYGFAPKEGAFEGARTFQQQMSHIATVLYMVGASMQGEKMPVAAGTNENGDAAVLASKDATVKYLKDSFAYCHKALQKFTSADQSGPSPFGGKTPMPYAGMASIMLWHSFDHYGQSVVYLRMNGIIPPASRK